MTDLFQWAETYPRAPGFKNRTTSRDAAQAIRSKAAIIQDKVLAAIIDAGDNGLTAHECAAKLELDRLTVSPRISELHAKRLVRPAEQRRKNASGMSAIVWRAA